jgi:hypothetical protein
VAALLYGLQADRFGVHRVTFPSLAAFVLLTVLTATAQSIERLILWRAVTTNGGDLRADPRRKGHPSGNRSEQPAEGSATPVHAGNSQPTSASASGTTPLRRSPCYLAGWHQIFPPTPPARSVDHVVQSM